jgi:hypothetical protein
MTKDNIQELLQLLKFEHEGANRAQMIPMFTLTEYRFFTVAKGTA